MLKSIKNFIQKHKYKIITGLSIVSISYLIYDYMKNDKQVTISAFLKAVNLNIVKEISIQGKHIFFKSNQSDIYNTFIGNIPSNLIYQVIQNSKVPYQFKDDQFQKDVIQLLTVMTISIVPFWLLVNQLKKSEISSHNIKVSVYKNKERFEDYYGGEKIKHKLKEVIDFLKNSQKFQKMGARMRRGILFYGPPGTGKTLLARALANQAGCQFIKVVASQFQQMFVGVGPKRVRQLFKRARSCQNGCIIFIDQIDGFGSRLNHLRDSHQTTSTINQLLTQMDGFLPNDKIVVVSATNRIDLVDSAILRAGRFDIKVNIGLPNRQQRIGILNQLLLSKVKKYQIQYQFQEQFGDRSDRWCGADIQLLINQSIYKAIKDKSQILTSKHMKYTLDNLIIQK